MSELPTVAAETTELAPATAVLMPLVLVADADALSRARRVRQLKRRGFRVSVARTPFEAIVKACCYVPAAIVIDDSLGDAGVLDVMDLLSTCTATAHIRLLRVKSGTRLPRTIARVAP